MEVVKNCDICQETQHAHQCKDCGKDDSDVILLCEDCHHAIHRGRLSSHKVEKAAGQEIRDFCSSLDTFKSKSSELKRRLEEVCNSKRDLVKYTQIHTSHIKEVATKLQQKIKSQAEQLIAQVQQVSEEKNDQLSECEQLCSAAMMQHQALCEEADEILGNPGDSLQDKTQKVAQFQGKLEVPLLTDLETKFPDVRIHVVCDVRSVVTAISEWQLTITPTPPDNTAEIKVGGSLQVEKGGELSVCVESRMSARGVFYVQRELDVPTREMLSALSLCVRKAGVLGALGEWTGGEGSLCAVRHPGDMKWYRGLVEELRKDRAAVRLLDYGTVETVPLANLAELPANLPPLPFQAVACTFFEDQTGEIPREARWLFSDLAAHKEVTCTFERELKTDTPVPLWKVDLQDVDGSVNIAERVIAAVKDKEAKSETVSCRDIRLKHNTEDFAPGALTVIRTNAASKDPPPEPNRSDSQTSLEGNVLTECTAEESTSTTSSPLQAETKTTSDSTSETQERNIFFKSTSVLDTLDEITVSNKDAETYNESNDGMVLSSTRPGPPLNEDIPQGEDTAASLVPKKSVSGTGMFQGTTPRILARGELYIPLQPTSDSMKCAASAPDIVSSSQEKGADARPAFSADPKQFHQAVREGDILPSFTDMPATERNQHGLPRGPPLWWEKMWLAQQGDKRVQEFHRIPGPQPPRTMYPPPGIPLPTAPPERYSALNRKNPHHFVPVGGMSVPGDLPPTWQGDSHPYLEGIISTCDGQVGPYPGMGDNTGAAIPPTAMTVPKMMSGFQDFGSHQSRDGLVPIDASLMSELTPCHGLQKTSDDCSSVSNGDGHLDGFSTKDRSMALASASNDDVIVYSDMESTTPVDQESCMVSSDKLYSDGVADRQQTNDLLASVPSVENRDEEADQISYSGGTLTNEETYTTESTILSSDATSLSAVDASSIKGRPGSSQATGGHSSGEDVTDPELEEFCTPGYSMLGIANQPKITLADKQETERLSTFVDPTAAVSSEAANMSTKLDSTSAATSTFYGRVATEVTPTASVNPAFPDITAAEEVHSHPQPSLTNGSLQHGHENTPEQAASVSSTEDCVIEMEVLSDEVSPTPDECASPLPVTPPEGDPDNSWVSTNESPVCVEDNTENSLPRKEAEKCGSSGECASTDIAETSAGNAAPVAEIAKVDHTYANVQLIADSVDKTGETSLEESAKLQDSCASTCSVGNSSGEDAKSRFATKVEGRELSPSLCKMSGANCANDMPDALYQKKEDQGTLAMVNTEMQVARDPPDIGTSSHPSHHEYSPPDRPLSMETAGSLQPTGNHEEMEDVDKPAVVPRESLQEGFVTGANMKVCVAHPMEQNGSFWIKNIPAENEMYKLMMDEMRADAPLMEALMEADCCSLGLLVCAVSPEENMWYRGRIEKKFSRTALVRFVDLGKAEEIAYVDIKPLPDKYHHMDFQVQKSFLAGVNTDLSEKQVELFNKLTANRRTLWKQVTCILPSGEQTVRLWESNDVEFTINQQVANTQKGLPLTADPGSLISVVQRSMPVVTPGAGPLDTCVYNQHCRVSTTRSLHVPGFQHGQFHSSPPHETPAHLGASNMEPIKRPKSAPPGPQVYLEDTYRGRQRQASGDEARFPSHLMGLLGFQSLTFQVQEVPFWSQMQQQPREPPVSRPQKGQQFHPYPCQEKASRGEQQHMERRPAQKQYVPPPLREDRQQKQQQTLFKSQKHKQLQSSEEERPQSRPLGKPYPRDLSTVGEGSQIPAENKAMTSGSSEDWDDAIDDWTDPGNPEDKEHKHPVLQQPYDKQQLAEGTSEESGVTTASDETGADSRSVSACSSPARSVQSAPSVFDEDDWVEGEDPLSQRADLGSQNELTQPGPLTQHGPLTHPGPLTQHGPLTHPGPLTQHGPLTQPGPLTQHSRIKTQGYLRQSGDTARQPPMESRSLPRNGTGAHSRRGGTNNNTNREGCHHCGRKGHIKNDCPSVNGRREQKNGRRGGGGGRRNNRW